MTILATTTILAKYCVINWSKFFSEYNKKDSRKYLRILMAFITNFIKNFPEVQLQPSTALFRRDFYVIPTKRK